MSHEFWDTVEAGLAGLLLIGCIGTLVFGVVIWFHVHTGLLG